MRMNNIWQRSMLITKAIISPLQSFPIKLINDINTLNLNMCSYILFRFPFFVSFLWNRGRVFGAFAVSSIMHVNMHIIFHYYYLCNQYDRLPNSISELPFNCNELVQVSCFISSGVHCTSLQCICFCIKCNKKAKAEKNTMVYDNEFAWLVEWYIVWKQEQGRYFDSISPDSMCIISIKTFDKWLMSDKINYDDINSKIIRQFRCGDTRANHIEWP